VTVAALARDAGADEAEIPKWIEVGRERKAQADLPPMSGGLHGGTGRPSPRTGLSKFDIGYLTGWIQMFSTAWMRPGFTMPDHLSFEPQERPD
jgi:hypothetical protein